NSTSASATGSSTPVTSTSTSTASSRTCVNVHGNSANPSSSKARSSRAKMPRDSAIDATAAHVGQYVLDPLGFVLNCFPWQRPGTDLANSPGPEPWQRTVLDEIGKGLQRSDDVIREAVASGHGPGKTALVAWIVLWGMATCVD